MRNIFILFMSLLFIFSCANSNEKVKDNEILTNKSVKKDSINADFSKKDVQKITEILQKGKTEKWFEKQLNEIIILVGTELLGTKYVANVLDKNKNEKLVVNIENLDCFTFVENCSVLASLIKSQKLDFESYMQRLQNFRYRDGKINGYISRLHYFSDWLYENEKRGNIKQFSEEIAHTPIAINVFFMTQNAEKYPLLNDSLIANLSLAEKNISAREYYYIPENEIDKYADEIPSGTIIGITTNIKGLDVVHTGLAVHIDGELHFLHASSRSMKVEISEKTLQKMLNDNKIQTGIMVSKLLK